MLRTLLWLLKHTSDPEHSHVCMIYITILIHVHTHTIKENDSNQGGWLLKNAIQSWPLVPMRKPMHSQMGHTKKNRGHMRKERAPHLVAGTWLKSLVFGIKSYNTPHKKLICPQTPVSFTKSITNKIIKTTMCACFNLFMQKMYSHFWKFWCIMS